MIVQELCSFRHRLHRIHCMTAWHMVCLPTWAPGVKEQDELNPPRSPQGHGVAAYWCVRGRADWQGHHIPRRAGDSGAPTRSVNVGRQTKGGSSAILLRGLRTCMWHANIVRALHVGRRWEILVKYLSLGHGNSQGAFWLFSQNMLNLDQTSQESSHAWTVEQWQVVWSFSVGGMKGPSPIHSNFSKVDDVIYDYTHAFLLASRNFDSKQQLCSWEVYLNIK